MGDASLDIETEQAVQADVSRLQQLLANLIRNAIEHGWPDITVTVGDQEDGFFVEDTGPGIPPADRDNVFEGGFSTSAEGTGFGLNIIKQIADAHGWDIQVNRSNRWRCQIRDYCRSDRMTAPSRPVHLLHAFLFTLRWHGPTRT